MFFFSFFGICLIFLRTIFANTLQIYFITNKKKCERERKKSMKKMLAREHLETDEEAVKKCKKKGRELRD